MAWYPKAAWKPIAKNYSKGGNRVDTVVYHTASDGPKTTSLFGWFNGGASASAHFFVRGDGGVEQYLDTNDRSWSAFAANSHSVSIETRDGGNNRIPWTPAQVDALVELTDWLCHVHQVPRRLCTAPTSGGLGWHEMFREWNKNAHECPGPVREAQVRNVILPRVAGAPAPGPAAQLLTGDDVKYLHSLHDNSMWVVSGTHCHQLTGPEWAARLATEKPTWTDVTELELVAWTFSSGRRKV